MNLLHWQIVRCNALRYLHSSLIKLIWLFYIGWLAILFLLTYLSAEGTLLGGALLTLFWGYMFSGYFWEYGWSVGSVDPITGMHTEKYQGDRYFMTFMACLPLARSTHFALQLLLYIGFCAIACGVSLLLHLLHPLFVGSAAVVLYLHFVLFAALLLLGGLETVFNVPEAFRGEIKSFKHPLVFRQYVFIAIWIVLLAFKNDIIKLLGGTEATVALAIVDSPVLLLGLLLVSGLLYWRGASKFSTVDIN